MEPELTLVGLRMAYELIGALSVLSGILMPAV